MIWRQAWIVLVIVATLAPPVCCCEPPRAGEPVTSARTEPASGCRSCKRDVSEQGSAPKRDEQRCACRAHTLTSAAPQGNAVATRAALSAWQPAISWFLAAVPPAPSCIRKASTAGPPVRSLPIRYRTLLI